MWETHHLRLSRFIVSAVFLFASGMQNLTLLSQQFKCYLTCMRKYGVNLHKYIGLFKNICSSYCNYQHSQSNQYTFIFYVYINQKLGSTHKKVDSPEKAKSQIKGPHLDNIFQFIGSSMSCNTQSNDSAALNSTCEVQIEIPLTQ